MRGVIRPRVKLLQHKAARRKPKTEQPERTSGVHRDEEQVVKDVADTGCTGVIHLYRRNQSRVGRQMNRPETAAKEATAVSGDVQRQRHRHQRFRRCRLRVEQRGSKEEDDGQQPPRMPG